MNIPQLVGHRGYPKYYPENTLCGLKATCPGACFVEVDIQLTRDLVPVVIHDTSLQRTAGVPGNVLEMAYAELKEVVVDERGRLGREFDDVRLPALLDVARWLERHGAPKAFIEIKEESLSRFGVSRAVDRVMQDLVHVMDRIIVISFHRGAVEHARQTRGVPVGWVMASWGRDAVGEAQRLAPDYLFFDVAKIPAMLQALPAGPWQWVLYDIVDPCLAIDWAQRGASLIETAAIGEMLAHPLLGRCACGA